MKLYELSKGDKIQLVFTKEDKQYISECEIEEIRNTFVITKQMKEDGVPVIIDKAPWYIRVIYQKEDGVPVIWDNVPAMDFEDKDRGHKGHIMSCTHDGWQQNRRGAFRLRVEANGVIFRKDNTEKLPITIKDISTSGISFISNADMDILGDMVMIQFKDEDILRTIQMNIRIVRKGIEHKRNVYGAIIISSFTDIDKYIADKQRLHQKDRLGL